MAFRKIFSVAAAGTMFAALMTVQAAAQETPPTPHKFTTTPDGRACDGVLDTARQCIPREHTMNTAERPYRPAGQSDGRLNGPNSGFGRRDRHLIYVATPGGHAGGQYPGHTNGVGIVVLDADQNYAFVKRIPTWDVPASITPEEVAGVSASPATNMIYLSTRGRLAAFDLATDKKVWENTYQPGTCCERGQVTPDGKTLVVGSDLKDFWMVIDAATGRLKGRIDAPQSMFAHNMALGSDGKTVFMAPNGVTITVGDLDTMKATKTITFSDHVRVFTINHDSSRIYANLNNLLGFEIADVKTGKVIKRIEAPAEMWKAQWGNPNLRFYGHGGPVHGIALTPDESEIWVVDNINYGVLVYDNTGEWPVLKETFKTTSSANWVTMGLDGKYAYLASGDVVDVKTKKIVATMKDEYGRALFSEKYLDMTFSNGKLQRTVNQFGHGIPAAVEARRNAKRASK
jgi:DNA-binding beta-propeller fold protein YncE